MRAATTRAILFDFDGVILDSVKLKTDLFFQCYEGELDEDRIAFIREHQAQHGGIGRGEKFRFFEKELFGRMPSPEAISRLMRLYQTKLAEQIDACALLPGALTFLERARTTAELHLVSGTLHEDLVGIVDSRNLTRCFGRVIGSPTPKTEAFRNIIAEYGYDPATVLAIGDAPTEFEAAQACGASFVGIVAPHEVNRFPAAVEVYTDLAHFLPIWQGTP
jgi:phosphoglycolate phosphatase